MKTDDLAMSAFMLGEMNGRAGDIVLDAVIGLSRFPEIVSLLKLFPLDILILTGKY